MKLVRHTFMHVFIHVALFTACALLIPVVSSALDGEHVWEKSGTIIIASSLLIVVCVYLMHKIKESVPEVMRSFGAMIFLPGALNVAFSIFSPEHLFSSKMTGMAVVGPALKFYVEHSVPTILSVAAVYMAVGGVLYWSGNAMNSVKDKFSWKGSP